MNPLFQKKTNDDQDPIILPQDDNEQGDMLDPATQRVAPPPPVAPAEDEKIVEPVRMASQKSAAANTPWDVYLRGKWINRVFSVPNMTADDVKRGLVDHDGLNPAIEVRAGEGRNVPDSVPLNRIGARRGRRPSGGSQRNLDNYLDAMKEGDRIRAEWAANKAQREEEEKSKPKNPLLQKDGAGAPIGMDQGQQTCYKCKQPIQQGQTISWEGGMESHMTCPPPPQGNAQEQSRIMFPKGQQPKKPQMGQPQPQTPQRAPNKPQYASKKAAPTAEYQADAYIEWGGMYDHRRCTLDEYKGTYEWTDWDASNELDLGKQVGAASSAEEAKSKLEQAVFRIGEPRTYIQFPEGPIKKQDYLQPTEKKFLKDVGVNEDIKPDLSNPNWDAKPEYSKADKARLRGLGVIGRAEKVATRRKISGYVPATSWGVPQEYAHRVAETLAHAGMRDFDVATDEELHVAYFSFGNEAEMEVSADIICEFYGPQIAASKGKWVGWQCRPERQPGVPDPQAMSLSKMNSKRAGSQGTRAAVAKLRSLGIKTTADLDKWIKEHPKTETKGPYAGSRSLMSRYDALKELVGDDAATWILHDLATDAAAKELPKRGSAKPTDFEGGTIEEQVANLKERRSFSEDGKGDGWVIYSRNTEYEGDGTWLKVFFKDGKVTKTDMFDEEPENVLDTRLGFDGLHSFTQAFGD